MSSALTSVTPQKTPQRDVDAVISARKAQLLSAKARNDQLYSTLSVRAQQRSHQKTPLSATKFHPSSENAENRPASPLSPTKKTDANSPWKNHLAMLKRAKEEAGEAKQSETVALVAAQEVNERLMGEVNQKLQAVHEGTVTLQENVKDELERTKSGLEEQLAQRLALSKAEVSSELMQSLEQQAAASERKMAELRARMDHEATVAKEALQPLTEGLESLRQHVDQSVMASAEESQAALDRAVEDVEARFDDKVVGHLERTCEALKDSFLEQFAVASAASSVRADATDQLVAQVAADQEAAKHKVANLMALAHETKAEMAAFKDEQTAKLHEVLVATSKMRNDMDGAVASAAKPAPAAQRFGVALAVWVAFLALVYAFVFRGTPPDTDRIVF